MPVIYSPGEVEVRPLDPDGITYTTAQLVADLLEIGAGEEVVGSANSDTNAAYILGTDLRLHGFAAADTVLVYSDADPVGQTLTVSTVASSVSGDSAGVGHVKITFTTTGLSPATDYQVADNVRIQNQASFTNDKTRGVSKAKVERLILRAQDIIDNKTHNAWRPYLVVGEYLNFDTYKPYRRRYYTDYVGTTPLLFRNVQQMLRVELWQGDDYREVGAAEARVKVVDHTALVAADALFLAPGGGGFATLDIGTDTDEWRSDFDVLTTAQNLADLINKDTRRGKTSLAFSPAFTLEGSTSNVGVNDEFLASANADYGRGIVKITSMRPSAAGETCTIAATNLTAMEISQVGEDNATASGIAGGTLTVDSTSGFSEHGLLMTGSGTGVTVASYTNKTATTFTGVADIGVAGFTAAIGASTGVFAYRLQIDFQGGSSVGDNARLRDWWIDSQMGIVYFNNSYPFFEWNAVKVSYIYGERYVEKAIEDVCTKMVAIELLMSEDRSVLVPEGTQNVDLTSKIQLWQRDIEATLPRYREVVVFE